MLYAPFGYKIMFMLDMPDGSKNGGFCDNPHAIHRVFEVVAMLEGRNLVIEDRTIYKEIELNDANSVTTY